MVCFLTVPFLTRSALLVRVFQACNAGVLNIRQRGLQRNSSGVLKKPLLFEGAFRPLHA